MMKRNMKTYVQIIAAVMTSVLLLSGCGGRKESYYESASATSEAYAGDEYWAEDWDMEYYGEMEEANGIFLPADSAPIENTSQTGQKLIKNVDLNVETKEFDEFIAGVTARVNELGGYIEYSSVSAGGYYSYGYNRYANLTLRIPADKLDGFVETVAGLGNVTYRSEQVEDVTLNYVDIQSRKAALETEQERLLELMEQSGSLEDLLTIESRLAEIRYEIESYESRLRVMDNQVTYSTVTINVDEVERVTPVQEKKTFGQEAKERLVESLYRFGRGVRSFTLDLISALPVLVLLLVIAAVNLVIVLLIVKKVKKSTAKRLAQIEAETNQTQQASETPQAPMTAQQPQMMPQQPMQQKMTAPQQPAQTLDDENAPKA